MLARNFCIILEDLSRANVSLYSDYHQLVSDDISEYGQLRFGILVSNACWLPSALTSTGLPSGGGEPVGHAQVGDTT